MGWKQRIIWFFFFICQNLPAFSQVVPADLQQYLESTEFNKEVLEYPDQIISFYALLRYEPAWIRRGSESQLSELIHAMEQSPYLGLRKNDYPLHELISLHAGIIPLPLAFDSIKADIRISDAAFHFFHDLAYGNTVPALGYMGVDYPVKTARLSSRLAFQVQNGSLDELFNELRSPLSETRLIEEKIRQLWSIKHSVAFREIPVVSYRINSSNKALLLRLRQLGTLDSLTEEPSDSSLTESVKKTQRMFDEVPDGKLHASTLRQLNVSLETRIKQLNLSLNYYRWMSWLAKDQPLIVVNIPAAYMKVREGNRILLEMRMVLGKRSTPTPTLISRIEEVILYPYWHVPKSIATRELLPAIKRDPGFLDAGNYQVLDKSGKIIDPYTVDWDSVNRNNFPYIIRQSTGCDNSLGLIKLDFENPFHVYLHDTPEKNLFERQKRFYSHGCLRMQKPMELGHLILQNNPVAIDTLEEKGCLDNQAPVTVAADVQMPVLVWYNPVDVDSGNQLVFYSDIYQKFR